MSANQHGWYTADEKAQHIQSYLSSNLSLTEYSCIWYFKSVSYWPSEM